jgi:hypothetical protein
MADDTELRKLIDDVNEIEKVAAEMKVARAEYREPSAEVRAILDRWERDRLAADEFEKWLDEQENWLDDRGPGDLV